MTRAYVRKTDGLRGFIWYQLTLGYVGKHGQPMQMTTPRIYLDHQTPRTDRDVLDVARSVGQTFSRYLYQNPLPTMDRKIG